MPGDLTPAHLTTYPPFVPMCLASGLKSLNEKPTPGAAAFDARVTISNGVKGLLLAEKRPRE